MKVNNILCEYLDNPIGLGIRSPRITWNDLGVEKQKAFEVIYKVNGNEKKDLVYSSSMNYQFKEQFNSRDIITYQIRISDIKDNWSELSEEHKFEMGLLEDSNWKANWIAGDYKVSKKERYPVDYFKKEFQIKGITKARLYISACGIYEAFINGTRVGDFILAPGSTDPRKRINYQSYDVTKLIKEGNNEINILLSDGWYRGSIGAKGFTYVFGKETKVKAQLELTINDGIEMILTDNSWNWCNDGPYLFADLKDGEIVDARKTPSYNGYAKEVLYKVNLTESNNDYVVENEISNPINMWKTKNDNIVLEFANNIAGYLSFSVDAHEGDKIDIALGEMLDNEGEVTLKNIQCIRKGKKTPL